MGDPLYKGLYSRVRGQWSLKQNGKVRNLNVLKLKKDKINVQTQMQEREVIPMENILGWIPPDPHLAPIMRVFQTTDRKTLLDFKARFLNYKAKDSLVPGINWIRQSRDQTDLSNDDRMSRVKLRKRNCYKSLPLWLPCRIELDNSCTEKFGPEKPEASPGEEELRPWTCTGPNPDTPSKESVSATKSEVRGSSLQQLKY